MAAERVQKIIAQVGIASRRKAEELVAQGLVTINGKVAQLGEKADIQVDAIKVEGKLIQAPSQPIYLALNKPRGVISALADPEGRPTLVDLLDKVPTRVFPVGNLEFNTEGLLLLTNDGSMANQLQNRGDVPWVYHVKVKGEIDPEMLGRIEAGAKINNRLIKPFSVRVAEKLAQKTKLEVVLLGPGGNELRTLFENRGFLVERITRTAIGQLTLHGLESGHFKMLKKSQVEALLTQPELGLRRIEQAAEKAEEKAIQREKGRSSREKVERAAGRLGVRRDRDDAPRAPRGEGKLGVRGATGAGAKRRAPAPRGEFRERRDEFRSDRGEYAPRAKSSYGSRPERGPRAEGGYSSRAPRADRGPSTFGPRPERGPSARGPRPRAFGTAESSAKRFPRRDDERAPRGFKSDRPQRSGDYGAPSERPRGGFKSARPSSGGFNKGRPKSDGFGSGPRSPRGGRPPKRR